MFLITCLWNRTYWHREQTSSRYIDHLHQTTPLSHFIEDEIIIIIQRDIPSSSFVPSSTNLKNYCQSVRLRHDVFTSILSILCFLSFLNFEQLSNFIRDYDSMMHFANVGRVRNPTDNASKRRVKKISSEIYCIHRSSWWNVSRRQLSLSNTTFPDKDMSNRIAHFRSSHQTGVCVDDDTR